MSRYEHDLCRRLAVAEDRVMHLEALIRKAIDAGLWYFTEPFEKMAK